MKHIMSVEGKYCASDCDLGSFSNDPGGLQRILLCSWDPASYHSNGVFALAYSNGDTNKVTPRLCVRQLPKPTKNLVKQ
jgi:hypothetical protein